MTNPYAAGSVWWCLVDFRDGVEDRKKYFILLSDCLSSGELTAFAFTTSKGEKHYPKAVAKASPCGCPEYSCFRIDRGQEACFTKPTWVQLHNVHAVNRAKLEQLVKEGKGGFLQSLEDNRFRSILNCANKSIDIEGWVLKLVDRTLKALNPSKQATLPSKLSAPPLALLSARAPTTSPEITAVRMRYEKRCLKCRAGFSELLEIAEEEVTAILSGLRPTPNKSFAADAETALDLVRPECACLVPTRRR